MSFDTIDAGALLQRCCLGHEAGTCGEACAHGGSTGSQEVVRDPGSLAGLGVLAPAVLRDLAAIAGYEPRLGNAVRVLADGTDSFGAMLDLVRNARNEILFENFIFRADAVGRAFATELRARADHGIRVKVLHDPVGSVMARRAPADLLFRRSSAEVRVFNLAWPTRRVRALGRDHRKLVVADGSKMVAGGICLADPWAGNCVRHCTWRDSAVYVEGPAVGQAADAFDQTWGHARRLVSPTASPPRLIGATAAGSAGDVPVRVIADLGPDRRTQALLERVVEAARREILITSPYFVPPSRLVNALVRALSRGVDVGILIPGQNNHPVAGFSAEQRLGPLLEHGAEVFRWRGAMIHAKSVVVDAEWSLVGSSNLDALSLGRNAELNVEIHGTSVGGIMSEVFRNDCRESMPFTLGDWRHRPPLRRLAGRLASALAAWQ